MTIPQATSFFSATADFAAGLREVGNFVRKKEE